MATFGTLQCAKIREKTSCFHIFLMAGTNEKFIKGASASASAPATTTAPACTWSGKVVNVPTDGSQAKVRLSCITGITAVKTATATATCPGTGTMTVTITGGPPVTPSPVEYVDDDETT